MSWKDIIRTDRLNKALSPEGYRLLANELVDDFAEEVGRLPHALITEKSYLLELKSTRYPENIPKYIKHYARLLDGHRNKIPEKFHLELDTLIKNLNGIAGFLE